MKRIAFACTAVLAFATCQAHAQMPTSPPATGRLAGNPDMSEVFAQVDSNHDDKMSRAEWDAQGLPQSSFNLFEKGRGYVTRADFENNAAPKGIDLNGDGKLTIAEFKAFDKMRPPMGNRGAPPPSAPKP